MVTKSMLMEWVEEALRARGGASNVVGVAKYIWDHYEGQLRHSGDLFYTWQYDIRWAAKKLRDQGVMKSVGDSRALSWELAGQSKSPSSRRGS
jgi:hypothetical protein